MPGVKRHEFPLNQKKYSTNQTNEQTNRHIYGVTVLHLYTQDGFTNFKCLNTQCVFIRNIYKIPTRNGTKITLKPALDHTHAQNTPISLDDMQSFSRFKYILNDWKKNCARHFHTWIRKNWLKKSFFFHFLSLYLSVVIRLDDDTYTLLCGRFCWCYLAAYNKFCTKS